MSIGTVLHNWGGLDYVPPAAYAEDLAELKGDELAELIARIAADGIYEVILIEDCVSAAKLEAWQNYLEESGRNHLWEKVRLLRLPRPGAVWQTETYLEQLLWGEMGDFARNLLKGQRGGDKM